MKKYLSLIASLVAILPCQGGTEAVSILVEDNHGEGGAIPETYTVPAGKVLIIEAVRVERHPQPPSIQLSARISYKLSNGSSSVTFIEDFPLPGAYNGGWHHLTNKIRLRANDEIDPPELTQYRILGLLVDEADLYAANLPVKLDNTRVAGNRLMADAKVASPRPHKLTVQSSPDLTGFAKDATATVTPTATTGTSVVSIDKGSSGQKFLRVSAKTRVRK